MFINFRCQLSILKFVTIKSLNKLQYGAISNIFDVYYFNNSVYYLINILKVMFYFSALPLILSSPTNRYRKQQTNTL